MGFKATQVVLLLLLAACGRFESAVGQDKVDNSSAQTRAVQPTTTGPTLTEVSTATESPRITRVLVTAAAKPTETPEPSETPAPTEPPQPTSTSTPPPSPTAGPDAVVGSVAINVRDGPSTAYRILGVLDAGTELAVTGVNQDRTWIRVAQTDVDGWVYGSLCEVYRNLDNVPFISVPPPTAPLPDAIQELAGVGGTIPNRTFGPDSPRKTGAWYCCDDTPTSLVQWCFYSDGYIGDQTENGLPNGVRYMATHIHQVNSDGTISVYVDSSGGVGLFTPDKIWIKDHPTRVGGLPATITDLEAGDCVLLFGVQAPGPVEVWGVR